ncbi:Chromosome partition protein Smc [Streptococcus infantarius subsp. infantarius]|nr:Chromosome partition protein Smc [Streptococcus infantarius subsp. infantarius]MCO4492125.1 Chromosome partition protein Smc [Streptococcus infantarius subsp. infantarius]MCO4510124.1 Chromosome partition protein Smc [Streptococcus infantarius subsp. infantarius]
MENVRIAIRDSTDSHNVAFFDNISGIRYQSANLQRFLAGSASILTIEYNSKDIDTIRTGCKLAFIYKQRAYWLNIMDLSKKGYKVEITAYSLGLELNQEERGAHKPANAMSFTEYLAYYDPEHALELGVNEVADKRIKLEWTGTDTILARLFSIANSFDAELEFTVELNQDYSLKRQVLNVYKKGNLGSNRAVSPVRVGRGLKVINYSDNLKELRTAVRATGKDGLTLDGLNKKVYDDDGNLLYYSNANTVYAPQSRDKYPSVGKKSNDNWIIKELGETEYSTQEDLWGYMLRELKKICVPEITYDIEGAVDGDVGDTRTLIDDVHYDPPLYVQARISELTEDLITGKVTKSTLTNFERKYSQVASELLKQVEQLANDAAPYIIRLETNNGFNFKNGKGSSTVTASLEKYGKIVGASWQWIINNSVVSDKQSATINASQVTGTLNVVAVASVDGNEVAREYITFTNSDDGVGIKSIKRYYTTNDQAEGVTAGGQNWSTKPTTVTADKNYMWSYDVITYTNDTSLVTEPAVIGARGDDGLDADTTGITEALDKAKQELTALSANIEKVRDDSLAAVEEAKQQLAAVANDLSKAKTDLQNAVSAVDTKATNLQSDLTTAKQDLQAQASQLTEQASAQSELTKRVSSVEETANGTKTTVSELSKTVDSNTKNITSVTARTKVVEDDLTSTKTTLSQVQTTANSASQKTATLETGLNGLGAKFENLQIGTVNLLHNSKGPFKPNANKVDNWQRFEDTYVYLENGKQYVLSGETDGNFTSIHDSFKESDNVVLWLVNPNTSFNKIMSDGKTGTTGTVFTWNSASGTYQLRVNTYRTVSTKSAWNIQIEEGNLRSTYSQNESDIESKVAEYKQTADQNYASLSSTVQTLDGQVQSNKTTAEQTAQGFSTRIESLETYKDGETTRANQYFELAKTETARQLTAERTAIAKDYVAKSTYTSDVTGIRNDLTATTTTANTTKTNLANYQASNDKAVANLQSNLQTANGNISSLQTKVEAVPGQITSAVSSVEGKIPTEIGSSNLLRNTAVNAENLKLFGKTDTTVSVVEKDGHQVYKLVVSGSSNAGAFFTSNIDYYNLIKDRNYTFSFWVLTNKDKNYNMYSLGHIQAVNTNGDNVGNDILHQHTQPVYSTNVIKANTWTKIWCTFKATSNSFFRPYFWYLTAGDEIYIYDMMLNEGKIPLSYTPAVEDTVSQISTLNTTLTQTAEGLTQLSTKVDTQGSTITSHTNSINSLSTGLSAKVSQTDFNTLSSRVTTAENNITAKANELSSKITSVEGKIPTSIGGTNLVRGTANFSSGWTWNTKVATVTDIIDDFNVYHSTSTGTNTASNNYDILFDNALTVLPGTEYTLSFWAKGSGTIYSHFFPSCVAHGVNSDGKTTTAADGSITHTLKSDWERYWVTWKTLPTVSGLKSLIPCRQPAFFKSEVWLYGVKLERGSVPTDWSPAPEDYDSKLAAAQSEIKQTTDSITASVSSVQTAASNAQSTANTAVSKADAAQAGVNTLDNTTVKTATLNLDNNGFVTKVGKTVNGNTFATMIAQNESDVQIIAKKMKVSGDMIVNGAITAEKLNVSNLSAVNSNLGKIEGGSLLLQENKAASSSIDSWGTFNRPAHKQGLYMDNHGLASSGAIQRKNSGETMPTDMPLAVLQSGELRFLVVDYNDNLENVLHYGLSDPDFGAIRFEIDSELKRRLTMTSSGYLNFQATNYTNWTPTGVSGCEYMIQGRLVLVNYDVTFNSAGTHTIGGIPQEFTKKSLMMTAKAWTITPRDKNIQLNSDGTLHILDAEANVNYRGTLVFSY